MHQIETYSNGYVTALGVSQIGHNGTNINPPKQELWLYSEHQDRTGALTIYCGIPARMFDRLITNEKAAREKLVAQIEYVL